MEGVMALLVIAAAAAWCSFLGLSTMPSLVRSPAAVRPFLFLLCPMSSSATLPLSSAKPLAGASTPSLLKDEAEAEAEAEGHGKQTFGRVGQLEEELRSRQADTAASSGLETKEGPQETPGSSLTPPFEQPQGSHVQGPVNVGQGSLGGRLRSAFVPLESGSHDLSAKGARGSGLGGSNSQERAGDQAGQPTHALNEGQSSPSAELPKHGMDNREGVLQNSTRLKRQGGMVLEPDSASLLGTNIDQDSLVHLALNPWDDLYLFMGNRVRFTCGSVPAPPPSSPVAPAVHQGRTDPLPLCPSFLPCPALLSSATRDTPPMHQLPSPLAPPGAISACSLGIQDPYEERSHVPPLNCRPWYTGGARERAVAEEPLDAGFAQLPGKLESLRQLQVLLRSPDLGCADQADFFPKPPMVFALYRLRDVFVSIDGHAFNESSSFLAHGCGESRHMGAPRVLKAGAHTVLHINEAINWRYRYAKGFYHGLIEALPVLWVMAPLLRRDPRLPILASKKQFASYSGYMAPLLGVPLRRMVRYQFDQDERALFRARTLYQPLYPFCGDSSPTVWGELRRRHLLHPQGIPMVHPDWSPRIVEPLSDAAMAAYPEDWVVVVAQRPGRKRVIVGMPEIEEEVANMFSPQRLVVFKGRRHILQARQLFNRARLFIAGHGGAMANMVFMPVGASVLEVRPNKYSQPCFHHLAEACSLQYHLVRGNGTRNSLVYVDHKQVMEAIRYIAQSWDLAL